MKSHRVIFIAVILHFFLGIILIISPVIINTTSTGLMIQYFSNKYIAGLVLIFISLLSTYSLYRKTFDKKNVFLLLPQQLFLILSAGWAINSVFVGHFSDGIIRSPYFILADQLPIILIAVFFTLAIFQMYTELLSRKT
jgi:hypothetical protein